MCPLPHLRCVTAAVRACNNGSQRQSRRAWTERGDYRGASTGFARAEAGRGPQLPFACWGLAAGKCGRLPALPTGCSVRCVRVRHSLGVQSVDREPPADVRLRKLGLARPLPSFAHFGPGQGGAGVDGSRCGSALATGCRATRAISQAASPSGRWLEARPESCRRAGHATRVVATTRSGGGRGGRGTEGSRRLRLGARQGGRAGSREAPHWRPLPAPAFRRRATPPPPAGSDDAATALWRRFPRGGWDARRASGRASPRPRCSSGRPSVAGRTRDRRLWKPRPPPSAGSALPAPRPCCVDRPVLPPVQRLASLGGRGSGAAGTGQHLLVRAAPPPPTAFCPTPRPPAPRARRQNGSHRQGSCAQARHRREARRPAGRTQDVEGALFRAHRPARLLQQAGGLRVRRLPQPHSPQRLLRFGHGDLPQEGRGQAQGRLLRVPDPRLPQEHDLPHQGGGEWPGRLPRCLAVLRRSAARRREQAARHAAAPAVSARCTRRSPIDAPASHRHPPHRSP